MNKYSCRNHCANWINDNTISGKCKIAHYYDGTIEYKNMLFIEAVGCASHSDFLDENGEPLPCVCGLTNEQCDEKNGWIQQEAREEMMSEVIKLLDEEFPMLQLVKQKVEGLRQNKQEELG
jgi:hypothetical protein